MFSKRIGIMLALLAILGLLLAACAGGTTSGPTVEEVAPAEESEQAEEPAVEEPAVEEPAEEAAEGDCSSEEVFCIGLVTDVGEVDDKSFNQSAFEGVQAGAEAVGGQFDYIETQDAKDYNANIDLFATNGYDMIVTVGFLMTDATIEAAKNYPDIDFIGVDQFQVEALPNLAGLMFNEDKAGFLAGALAAQLTETDTIAQVLGTNLVPPVVAFKVGFEKGAQYINPDINIISTYHPGGVDVAFTDPEWGGSTARQALDQGADVIFGAGGKTGNGALEEVAGEEGAFCIGVDTDQWLTVPAAHGCLVTSAMKLITPGVSDLIQQSFDGQMATGNYFGPVGLAPFHDFEDAVPQEVKDQLAEIDAALTDGSMETGYIPGETE